MGHEQVHPYVSDSRDHPEEGRHWGENRRKGADGKEERGFLCKVVRWACLPLRPK